MPQIFLKVAMVSLVIVGIIALILALRALFKELSEIFHVSGGGGQLSDQYVLNLDPQPGDVVEMYQPRFIKYGRSKKREAWMTKERGGIKSGGWCASGPDVGMRPGILLRKELALGFVERTMTLEEFYLWQEGDIEKLKAAGLIASGAFWKHLKFLGRNK